MPRRAAAAGLVLLVAVFLTLSVMSGLSKSPTADENRYAGFGKYLIRTGEFDNLVLLDQPPLAYLLISAPFLPLDTPPASGKVRDRKYNSVLGRRFILENSMPRETVLLIGRSVVGLAGAALAVLVGITAWRRYGRLGALIATAAVCLSPNFLAHSRVMTSDVIAALFTVAAVVAWARFLEEPGRWRGLAAGALLGLALLAKVASLLLLPAIALAGLAALVSRARGERLRWLKPAAGWGLLALVLAALLLWGGYGFEVGPVIPTDDPVLSKKLWLSHWQGTTRELLTEVDVPAPAYARLVMYVKRHSNRGHPAYMNGRISETGFPLFYPYCMLVKLPLGTLLLLLLTAASFFRRRPSRFEATLLVAAAVLLYMSMRSNVHTGIRHLLPVLGLLYLLLGRLPAVFTGRWLRVTAAAALVATAVSVGIRFPHYIPYMNEAAGGPANGFKHLADSNLDWGQDLGGLKRWMDARGVERIRLNYFGCMDPSAYGIDWVPVGGPGEAGPEWMAVSATNLLNIYAFRYGDMTWVRELEPVTTIGHSIFVYHLPEAR